MKDKYSYIFACLLLFLANACQCDVIEHPTKHKTYLAKHSDGQSLLKTINNASPFRENGQIFHAYTHWYVSWQFKWQTNQDGECQFIKVTTEVTSDMTLPKLVTADQELKQKFADYLNALRIHEQGHLSNGVNAAYAIDELLTGMPAMKNCERLKERANDAANKKLQEFIALDKQYDEKTQHGKTQGAFLDNI